MDEVDEALAEQRAEIVAALQELRADALAQSNGERDLYIHGIEDSILTIERNF